MSNENTQIVRKQRNKLQQIKLFFKGVTMGACDIIPGVSGGTIALISGIYEELIDSLKSINISALKALKENGIKGFWIHINGNFLVVLFSGILFSIFSLARAISYLYVTYPVILWSFFFGLILASIIYILKAVKIWNLQVIISLTVGTALAYFVINLPPMASGNELWFIFFAGMIAICAMILPGISGSFILLILGVYKFIISSIKSFDVVTLAVFAGGCIIGLISFSKILNWLFKRFHDLAMSALTGFLIGSLPKIWPWKSVQQFTIISHSNRPEEFIPLVEKNVLPDVYSVINVIEKKMGIAVKDPFVLQAILIFLLGFSIFFVIEYLAKKLSTQK